MLAELFPGKPGRPSTKQIRRIISVDGETARGAKLPG
jgi:hypothetical protein